MPRWQTIVDGHEVLRSRLDRATMTLVVAPVHDASVVLREVAVSGALHGGVAAHTGRAVDRLDPERGVMLAAVWLRPPTRARAFCCWPRTCWPWTRRRGAWCLGELDAALHALIDRSTPRRSESTPATARGSRVLTERA